MTTVPALSTISRDAVEQLSKSKNEPDWMRSRRLGAWDVFESLPMPVRADEGWRYMDLAPLRIETLDAYPAASGDPVESPLRLEDSAGGLISHQNSRTLRETLAAEIAEQGVLFMSLDEAVQKHADLVERYFMTDAVRPEYGKFAALNGALWSGGTFLYVPRGVQISMPLRTLYTLTAGGAGLFTHTLVIVEENAQMSFIEEYASSMLDRLSLNAGVVELIVKQAARATFVTLQEWTDSVLDLSVQRAVVDRDATLDWLAVGLGAGTSRTAIEASLRGQGASSQMLGVIWGYGDQHTEFHTLQDHVAPNTTSDLLYKAALSDRSRSVFSGFIRVEKGAQGTDAYQTNRSLLLSDSARAFPSPNLEIEANEVRCSHGASVGKVDPDQLFYLMARGIPEEVAARMIVEGFFGDVLRREPVAVIRERLADLIARKMERAEALV